MGAPRAAGIEESRRQALTDDLTGLGNRRRLLIDLERAIAEGTDHSPAVLAMFDLDGFKAYNDTHGHPAGDALLARLGTRLEATFTASGTAYRLGGDEFCVLLHGSPAELEDAIGQALEALTEQHEAIRSSCGFALLPREARDASSALRIVDQRMYAQKDGHRVSTKRQARDLLLAVVDQHAPDLRPHSDWVAELARSVAEQLAVAAEAIDDIVLAADLHDVGKVVIPRSILHKPGPLDKAEWDVIRRHTLTGEAILNAAPVLGGVAAIVRSTHERVDGGGYPDGLAGADIPLGARIIAVCDAYDAMTSDRSYRGAMTRAEAIRELDALLRHAVRPDRRRRRAHRARAPHRAPTGRRPPAHAADARPLAGGAHPGAGRRDQARAHEGRPRPAARRDRPHRRARARPRHGRDQHVPARVERLRRLERPRQRGGARRRCSARPTGASGSTRSWRPSTTGGGRT